MKRKQIFSILAILFLLTTGWSQAIPDYYSRSNFLFAPPSSFQDGLVGFTNPANLQMINKFESRFFWNTDGTDLATLHNWGFFTGVRGLGFGMLRQNIGDAKVSDYKISSGFGSEGMAFGLAYGWSTGDSLAMGRENLLTVSSLFRPNKYLSVGIIGNFSTESDAREGVLEVGIRPLGTPQITLFADGALQKETRITDAPWSAGAAVQLLPGIHLIGRYFENETFTAGLSINLGMAGVGAQAHFDSKQNHAYTSYMTRSGGMQPSIFPTLLEKNKHYLPIHLKGRVEYQKYILFDKKTHRFMDILQTIRAAKNDPRISLIALNLSGMRVLPEHAWEIREELKAFRKAGKKVVVFIDNAGMSGYHLASVADYIVLDPQGSIQLPGFVMGRTFLKGTLDKLGLGFDEWRFFKYKSAAEALSRKNMSEADREQRQAYIDDWYELVRQEVSEARNLSPEKFDNFVDSELFFLPDRALEVGLVDTLARWSAIDEVLKNFTRRKLRKAVAFNLLDNALPSQQWGEKPKIAVVYGLGICAMDEGIKARWLERVFLQLAQKKSVKAVVFRVDSPGGDGMASDVVAEALKKCSEKKPVIISQGQVAGSGGYWISMYGDTIVAGPNTITGSIGVIGGWLYDKGFSDKIGMTSDHVQRGAHADLGFGIRLPFIGAQIPARNLTSEERKKVEHLIKKFYDIFVEKVANGRGMPVEEVRKIAEGHFYSGTDGKQIGLVDEVGGIMTALAIAQQRAGISPEDEIEIIEIPKYKGLFQIKVTPFPVQSEITNDPVLQYIRMVSEHAGQPLPLLPPGSYPTLD